MKNILTLCSLVCVMCTTAFAAIEIVDGIEWTYSVSNGTARIENGYNPAIPSTTTGVIAIPSTLGDYPVTSIGSYAFLKCSGLTSVMIPKGVTSIGEGAFEVWSQRLSRVHRVKPLFRVSWVYR